MNGGWGSSYGRARPGAFCRALHSESEVTLKALGGWDSASGLPVNGAKGGRL